MSCCQPCSFPNTRQCKHINAGCRIHLELLALPAKDFACCDIRFDHCGTPHLNPLDIDSIFQRHHFFASILDSCCLSMRDSSPYYILLDIGYSHAILLQRRKLNNFFPIQMTRAATGKLISSFCAGLYTSSGTGYHNPPRQ